MSAESLNWARWSSFFAKRSPVVMGPGSALRFAALVRDDISLVGDDDLVQFSKSHHTPRHVARGL
jgi:hypothetical protein